MSTTFLLWALLWAPPHLPSARAAGLPPQGGEGQETLDFSPDGPIADPELGQYYAELDLAIDGQPVGTLVVEVWPEKAPATARNFLRYCSEGFYAGLGFHRVLREFMIQGGDPEGDGTGKGPYGNLPDEFSGAPEWGHRYGVLSMAHAGPGTASCQFFVCCADNPSVWNLDGKYSSFGRLSSGVAALEAAANVPVRSSARGEPSEPTREIRISATRVTRGEAPREAIERPAPDLGGEPERVRVQRLRLVWGGPGAPILRDAEARANALAERGRAGEDFLALIHEHSADPPAADEEHPALVRILNRGAFDVESARTEYEAQQEYSRALQELTRRYREQEIGIEELARSKDELRAELDRVVRKVHWNTRDSLPAAFADLAFSLEPGGIGVATVGGGAMPRGCYVVKRLD